MCVLYVRMNLAKFPPVAPDFFRYMASRDPKEVIKIFLAGALEEILRKLSSKLAYFHVLKHKRLSLGYECTVR